MNTIQRLADARNCLEGKIVAVVLSVLMTLSFLNISVFADTALARENFDGEVGEKTTEPAGASEADANATMLSTGEEGPQTPAVSDDAAGTTLGDENGASDAEAPLAPTTATELTAQANDSATITVARADREPLPEGTTLKVDTALTDKVQASVRDAIAESETVKGAVAYNIALCDEAGEPMVVDAPLKVTIKNPFGTTVGLRAFSVDGETATPLEADQAVVLDIISSTFVCDGAPVLIAVALTEPVVEADTDGADDETPAPSEGNETQEPSSPSENTVPGDNVANDSNENDSAANEATDSDKENLEAAQIVMYVGESRTFTCPKTHDHDWQITGASGTNIGLRNTKNGSVIVDANDVGTATISCGDTSYRIVVKAAPETAVGKQIAHFYFIPAEEGATASLADAKFLGSGTITVPDQYQSQQALYEGTLCGGLPVSLTSLIDDYPSDEEIRNGLAAYYKDVIDNDVKRPNYDSSWTYSYVPYLIEGPVASKGYNGASIKPDSAYHVYVQLSVKTSDAYAVSYQVKTPTTTKLATVSYGANDTNVVLPMPSEDAAKFEIGGTSYDRVLVVDGGKQYVFDGWYTDATYRVKAPAIYEACEPTTFYGRYVAADAPTVTFDAGLGTFADGQKGIKALQVNDGERYWLPEAPTRANYEFVGWYLPENDQMVDAGDWAIMGSDDVDYVAVWRGEEASFVFDAMGGQVKLENGSLDAEASYKGYTGEPTEGLELPEPIRSGFTFRGWYADENLSGSAIEKLPSEFAGGTTTYYAKWEIDPAQCATVTYRASTGGRVCRSETALTYGEAFYDTNIYMGGESGILGCDVKAIPGYTFVGWFKVPAYGQASEPVMVADGKLSSKLSDFTVKQNLNSRQLPNGLTCYEDTIFEARFARTGSNENWERANYEIEYYLMNADGSYEESPQVKVFNSLECLPDTELTLASLPSEYQEVPEQINGTPTGYQAKDYRRNAYYSGQVTEGVFAPTDGQTTVVFKLYFDRLMSVTFATDSRGSLVEDDELVEAGEDGMSMVEHRCWPDEALPAAPQVTAQPGYQFAGWEYVGFGNAGKDLSTTEDVAHDRLYTATYIANSATIAFVSNGGSVVETLEGATGDAVNAALPTPTREGYTFEGWYANETFQGEALTALPETFPAGDTVYYAKWTAERATIRFDRNAADVTGSQTGIEGVTDRTIDIAFPEGTGLAREGYVFAGWNTKADGTGDTVTAFPATFPAGHTTYYAQWKLDVRGLDAASFSTAGTYNGRGRGIALPSTLKMKDGEKLTLLAADNSPIANPYDFAKDVADTARNLTVVVSDAKGNVLARISGVSVVIEPATLTVTTSSIIYPFDGNAATSDGIAVTGLQNGETLGYRTTGTAFQVGDEVTNSFELTWADGSNNYTAKSANYRVVENLGTIRVVSSACPVKVEGYVGVYDGAEHAISYEVAAEEAAKATISFDAPTAYTNAGTRTINYTVECADHGTTTGSIDLKILPRPVTIAVEDSFKIASTLDPEFTGAIVEGDLVQPNDLGAISFVRTNDDEEIGFYPEVLTANYLRNSNYDVEVIPGTFTIGPAGSAVVPPSNPLLPPRTYSSLGAGMPEGATTPAGAIAGVVTTLVGPERARAAAQQFGAVTGIILDDEVPMAATVSFSDEEPTVTRIGGEEVIEDDATALGAFDEPHCWVHWLMAVGILLTIAYAAVVVMRRLGYARKIGDFDDGLTGNVATEETRAARAAHTA